MDKIKDSQEIIKIFDDALISVQPDQSSTSNSDISYIMNQIYQKIAYKHWDETPSKEDLILDGDDDPTRDNDKSYSETDHSDDDSFTSARSVHPIESNV